jgi:hypothetical protein
MFKQFPAVTVYLLGALMASEAAAQELATLGSRAAAMAAFVAVADDASAVAWNPSGLVSGPIFNIQFDLGRQRREPGEPMAAGDAAGEFGSTLVALGTLPVGLAYYRFSTTHFEAGDPAAGETPDRQDRHVRVRTLVTNHFGATVQQSLGNYLTVGATIKLVRGSVGSRVDTASSWDEAFDRVEPAVMHGSTRGDLDIGAMFAVAGMRAGVVVRNVTAPSFGEEEDEERVTLPRHVRVGAAWGNRWPGASPLVLSADADLTRVPNPEGDRRDIALGAERWLGAYRFGVRGGVRASTIGDARVIVSAGGSIAVRSGIYVDAFVTRGEGHDSGWGLAARLSY